MFCGGVVAYVSPPLFKLKETKKKSIMAKVKKITGKKDEKNEAAKVNLPPIEPLEAMDKLSRLMNNTPIEVKTGIGDFKITALKPGTQWLIAEEAIKIQKSEKGNFMDMIKHFSVSIPSVAKVIALAVLNDRDRIYKDYRTKELSDEYTALYDSLMWESNQSEWIGILVKVLGLLEFDFFFDITNVIATVRDMTLERKRTMDEQKSSSAERNGVR